MYKGDKVFTQFLLTNNVIRFHDTNAIFIIHSTDNIHFDDSIDIIETKLKILSP